MSLATLVLLILLLLIRVLPDTKPPNHILNQIEAATSRDILGVQIA